MNGSAKGAFLDITLRSRDFVPALNGESHVKIEDLRCRPTCADTVRCCAGFGVQHKRNGAVGQRSSRESKHGNQPGDDLSCRDQEYRHACNDDDFQCR